MTSHLSIRSHCGRLTFPFYLYIYLNTAFITPAIYAACYVPNGILVEDTAFQPCHQGPGIVSHCCATNRASGGLPADECLPNGLCRNVDASSSLTRLWRESCTDQTWESPFCPSFCVKKNSPAGGDATTNYLVTQCPDNSYCCGVGNTTCCDEKQGFAIAATIGSSTTSSSSFSTAPPTSSPTSSSSVSSSTSVSVTSAATDTSQPSSGLSTGAKAGIGVGTTLGVLAVAFVLGLFLYARRRKRKEYDAVNQDASIVSPGYFMAGDPSKKYVGNEQREFELASNPMNTGYHTQVAELPPAVAELPSTRA